MPHDHDDPRPRYHLSGALGAAPPLLFAVALFGGMGCGFLLGILDIHNSSDRIAIGFPLVIGVGIGYACFWIALKLRCRNALFVQAAALLGGFAAVYGLAVGFLSNITQAPGTSLSPVTAGSLFASPSLILSTYTAVANAAVISRGRSPVAAGQLHFLWSMQALILLVPGVICARISMLRQVYCEDCQKWLAIGRKKLLFPVPDDRDDLGRLEVGDLSVLLEQALHRPIHASRPPYVRLDYVLCNDCGNTGVFRVMSVTPKTSELFASWTRAFRFGPDEKTVSEDELTYLMQLTPDAAHQLGQLQERDRESKAVNPKGAARPIKPMRPAKSAKPTKPLKRPGPGKDQA